MPTPWRRRLILLGRITFTISGTVYDADGSTAVASATVALGAYSTTSAGDGTYTITGVVPGTSGSMTCTKTGYSWTAITVAAMSANLTSQNYTNAWYAAGGSLAICIAAWRPKGAATYAASKVNLANPGTYDAVDGAAYPTWDAINGWKADRTQSQYLATGITPVNNQTWSGFVRFTNAATIVAMPLFGAHGLSSFFMIEPYRVGYFNGDGLIVVPALTSGVLGVAGTVGYRNGVAEAGTIGTASGAFGLLNIFYDSNIGYCTAYIQACAIWNTTLNSTQSGILYTAMAAL